MAQRDEREITAYHEAGHAVMAMACGYPVSKISIRTDERGLGRVIWHPPTDMTDRDLFCGVLILMSGIAADFIHWKKWGNGSAHDMPEGHFDDQRQAHVYLTRLNENHLLDAYILEAKLFSATSDVWNCIQFIAGVLLAAGGIDGVDFLEKIAEACPKIEAENWARLNKSKQLLASMRASP